ncbi:MAG: hypothetical protein K9I85_11260 [Saprospiraceae bacterium]|nr:hypothetical protein [Saprospiraceae bacterium]
MITDEEKIHLVAFGMIAELLESPERSWPWVPDTDRLKATLIKAYPELNDLPFILAVDMEVIQGNQLIVPGVTVALLPPYSGG